MLKRLLVGVSLLAVIHIHAQNQERHKIVKTYKADSSLSTVKEYINGKRTGIWVNYSDSGNFYRNYRDDSLRRSFTVTPNGDTLNDESFSYIYNEHNMLTTTCITEKNRITTRKFHAMDGSDSIVEKIDSAGVFKVIYSKQEDAGIVPETIILTGVEQPARFKGGPKAMQAFLDKTLVYPREALDKGISGRVWVKFAVDENGNVSLVSVYRSSGFKILDDEAMRVVKHSTGLYLAGKRAGVTVKSWCILPIEFIMPR